MMSSSEGHPMPSGGSEEVPKEGSAAAANPSATSVDDTTAPAGDFNPTQSVVTTAAPSPSDPPPPPPPPPAPSSQAAPSAPVIPTSTATTTTVLTPRLGSRKSSFSSSSIRSPVLLGATAMMDSPRILPRSRQPSPSSSTASLSASAAGPSAADTIVAPLLTSNSSSLSHRNTGRTQSHQQQPQEQLLQSNVPPLLGRTKKRVRSSRHLPRPANQCPLLCCYYAEFDNQVGPKVCYQTPPGFMERYPLDVPISEMEAILGTTLEALLQQERAQGEDGDVSDDKRDPGVSGIEGSEDAPTENQPGSTAAASSSPPPPLVASSSPTTSTADDASIFASCSDFIITGSELTGSILNLSTHQIHVLSRPTLLSHDRYERNALLFSAGFVLRRTEDPRPFRAVLNHLSSALADAEHETQFLSRPNAGPHVLRVLEQLLLDLNSPSWESHLHLDAANVVNLKLFHPPKAPAKPVPEYAVPIVLRRDRHVQLYDWDLAINWVSLHVDGILNSRQIARVAEVDLDMVLQCLRVLRHHSVIALVDMFFFTNRYEGTDKAAEMLAGHHPDLLLAAVQFCAKGGGGGGASPHEAGRVGNHGLGSRGISHNTGGSDWSPSLLSNNSDPHFHPRGGALGGGNGAGAAAHIMAPDLASSPSGVGGRSASYDDRHPGGGYFHGSPRYHRSSLDSNAAIAGFSTSPGTAGPPLLRPEDEAELKAALAEMYCACHSGVSIGDLWVELLSSSRGAGGASKRWRRAFQKIDHRRFTSFGLVHGLLRRMHCYPMVMHSTLDDDERELMSAPEPELSSANVDVPPPTRERSARSSSAGSHSRPPSSTQAGRLPLANPQTDRRTILKVAHLMDGTRCDDEIVSLIGQPLEALLEMVADRSVTCTYAPGSHY